MIIVLVYQLLIKKQLDHMLYLLVTKLLNKFRFPDSNTVENILQTQLFTYSYERLDIGA